MANQNDGPQNERFRPFQGGTDSLTAQPTMMDQVRSAPWADSDEKGVTRVPNVAKEADTAASSAMMAEPD